VPGILFSSLKLSDKPANIIDLAPTTLELFGIDKPNYMDGKSLLRTDEKNEEHPVAQPGRLASTATGV